MKFWVRGLFFLFFLGGGMSLLEFYGTPNQVGGKFNLVTEGLNYWKLNCKYFHQQQGSAL